ncbi:MAG: hypothetical protein ACFFB7_07805, partial [Candidatus Sifarchaeia archaeon]
MVKKVSRVLLMLILLLFASAVVFPASNTAPWEKQSECDVEFERQSNTCVGGLSEIPINTPIQITYNLINDYDPRIHDGMVTWIGRGYDENEGEIFLYDGATIHQLTDNDWYDDNPEIHNGMVTWQADNGIYFEIFLYDGTTVRQLSEGIWIDKQYPKIHDGMVTWQAFVHSGLEIFLYDGSSVVQITNNEVNDASSRI